MLTVDAALKQILETVSPFSASPVPIQECLGRVLACDIVSDIDSPPFDKALMDGYAIRAEELQPESAATFRVIEEVTAGNVPTLPVNAGEATRIMTGAPLPSGANAVVPVEFSQFNKETGEVVLTSPRPLKPAANILPQATVMSQGETVLTAGTVLRPQEIAVLAEMGIHEVEVARRPEIAILATGDELVPISEKPGPGQIRNTNEAMLSAQVKNAGGQPRPLGIARDTRESLHEKISQGLECDVLLLSGGVSAGKLDLVPSELDNAGVQQTFHKVSIKPGKPLWFGVLKRVENPESRPCYVFGLPGNPVSSMVCFEVFVRTAIRRLMGATNPLPQSIFARLEEGFNSPGDRTVYFPARWQHDEHGTTVRLVNWKGSADLRSTTDANGLAIFPADQSEYPPDEIIQVLRW
ncbi:MAG: molybdopterin molybdotransferase MoeA [Planctomycetaceae bacterium]